MSGSVIKRDTLSPLPLKIDKETEESIFSDKDYVYTKEVKKSSGFFSEFFDWLIRKIFGDLSPESVNGFWRILSYILAALFIAGLIFIFVRMKGGRLFKGDSARTPVFADILEDIKEIDTADLIQKAKNKGDYRLAFRYSFLRTLQLMNDKKYIDWKTHKTNREYYNEFAIDTIKPLFKELYLGFEYVWYGDSPINSEVFEQYSLEFNEFNRQISV